MRTDKPCEYCGVSLPLGVDKATRRIRSFHFAQCTKRPVRLAELAYPHHCAPEDVDALVQRLEALADPEQEAAPSYENTDWRTLAAVCARVIKYQRRA